MPYCSTLRDAINCGRFRRRCTQPRTSTVCTGFLCRAAFAPGSALRSLRIKLKQSGRQAAGQVRLGLLLPPGSPAIASLFPPKLARALPPSSTCPKPLPARTFPAGGAPRCPPLRSSQLARPPACPPGHRSSLRLPRPGSSRRHPPAWKMALGGQVGVPGNGAVGVGRLRRAVGRIGREERQGGKGWKGGRGTGRWEG